MSRLWFEALAGICAHVRRGGGGLTPSDIAPARLNQQQIDKLRQHFGIADILPLTPLQQGLLFHASTAQASDDVYAVQLDIALSSVLDQHRLRAAVHTVISRHPHLAARFDRHFDEPVQLILADRRARVALRRARQGRFSRGRGADRAAVRRRARRGLRVG